MSKPKRPPRTQGHCDRELSERLVELGFRYEVKHYWDSECTIPKLTAKHLLKLIPKEIRTAEHRFYFGEGTDPRTMDWSDRVERAYYYRSDTVFDITSETTDTYRENALAKMLIALVERGRVKLRKS